MTRTIHRRPVALAAVLLVVIGVVVIVVRRGSDSARSTSAPISTPATSTSTAKATSTTTSTTVNRSEVWRPKSSTPLTLGWVLGAAVDPANPATMQTTNLQGGPISEADVYDIDGQYATAGQVSALHAQGKKVICYVDLGVWEDYRPDAGSFPGAQHEGKRYTGDPRYANVDIVGSDDDGWNGSKWLDIRRIDILEPIMMKRLVDWCQAKGFDSVEPDEITDYSNHPGFPLTYQDQLAYNRAVAGWVHSLGMSVGLKGDIEQARDLEPSFDWTLNEECFMYDECTSVTGDGPGDHEGSRPGLQTFVDADKAVWVAEYPSEYPPGKRDSSTPSQLTGATSQSICRVSATQRFNTAFYILGLPQGTGLKGGRTDCPG
jgi:hypothetical protein